MSFEPIDPQFLKSLFVYKNGHLYKKLKNNTLKQAGRLTPNGYRIIEINGTPIMEHRLVWIYFNGALDNILDHINGVRDDNRIENLRVSFYLTNSYNKKIGKNSTTGIKGIRLRKDTNKYEARICIDGNRKVLGSFNTLDEATVIVKQARIKYHGEFAHHG